MIHINLRNKISDGISIIDLHKSFVADTEGHLYRKLNELKDNSTTNTKIRELYEFIIKNINEIAIGDIETLKKIRETYLNKVASNFNYSLIKDSIEYKKFHKKIRELFEKAYNDFLEIGNSVSMKGEEKEWHAYNYIESLNIKICPYCHAQYINTIRNNMKLFNAGKQARPALDHFIPKSIFPIFAVSLYNLVPACTYCNSYFKSDYYSTFETSYSPFEQDIEQNFKFKLTSVGNELNVFEQLKKIKVHVENSDEKNYLYLIGYTGKPTKDTLKKLVREFKKILNEQNKLEVNVKTKNGTDESELKQKISAIKISQDRWLQTVSDYLENYYGKNNSTKEICNNLNERFNRYIDFYNKFDLYKNKKEHTKFKTKLTSLRDLMHKITRSIFAIEFYALSGQKNEKFNFVDVNLGKSNDYMIQIVPEENCNDDTKRKVLSNVALFQLDGIYEEFKPYISEKNKQLHLVNKVYLQNLVNNFPKLIGENIVEEFSDSLFYTNESFRDQILGKLIYDIFKPNSFK